MRALPPIAAVPFLLLTVLSNPAPAEWYETRLTETPTDARRPTPTFDANDDLHVLWEEAGEIRHRMYAGASWGDVDVVGTGSLYDRWTCLG